MHMLNDETGERSPGQRVGTDENGDGIYLVADGWTPDEPHWRDADGYAHAGAEPVGAEP